MRADPGATVDFEPTLSRNAHGQLIAAAMAAGGRVLVASGGVAAPRAGRPGRVERVSVVRMSV